MPSTTVNKRKRRTRQRTGENDHSFATLDSFIAYALLVLLAVYTCVTVVTFGHIPTIEGDHVNINLPQSQPIIIDQVPDVHEPTEIEKFQHRFPVHVDDDFEEIQFPAYLFTKHKKEYKMKVPKFWDPQVYGPGGVRTFLGNYGERLITPEEASQIGSFNEDGLQTIFVSIASYRDPECPLTIEDMFLRAKHPERIRLAVVDQMKEGDPKCSTPPKPCEEDAEQVLCKYRHLMDFFEVNGDLSVGPVFARHLAHRMYRGEYFAMQIDAHVRFVKDWDDDLIGQWELANNEMAVATTYPSDLIGAINPVTHKSQHFLRPIMCKTGYEGNGVNKHLRHGQQPEAHPLIKGEPMLEPFWAAGFSFARGHFVVQVPYDQFLPWVFQGEEISIALRAFTHGYDFYAPERSVCFHMYAIKENKEKRKKVKLFWENSKEYTGVMMHSMKRLNGIIGMGRPMEDYYREDEHKYGMGKVRKTAKFFETFGIHVDTETVEGNLCKFVSKSMMEVFKPALRSNRMGLDYDKIDYVFKDTNPVKKKKGVK